MKYRNELICSCLLLSLSINMGESAIGKTRTSRSKDDSPQTDSRSRKVLKGRIDRQVVMADELMLKGKYGDAAELYKQALNRNPKSVSASAGLGMAYAKQFKLDAANEQFDKVLSLDSRNAMAHSGKAMVIFNRLQSSSNTVIKNKSALLRNAESECKQGLSIDPGMPEAHYTLGMIYKEEGNINDAINEFEQATKIDPQYSEAFAGLGLAQLQNGNKVGAQTSFKKAISLNSGNSTAHYGMGRSYLQDGLYDDAIKELNTALYQNPNSWPTRLAMGEAYQGQGNTVAAINQYHQSIGIKPENPEAYLHIADIREQRGDLEHSIAELRSGLELMPNDPQLHSRVAEESLRLEKLDDAIKEYESVLDAQPQNAQAAKGLTRAYYLKANKETQGAFFASNEFEKAKASLDKAIRLNPNDMELRLAQAKLRALSGEKVDLSQIGTPTNDGERIAYAEALLAQNRFKDADQQMSQVINNAQDAKQAFAVADLALMIRDLNNAEAAYRKAATMPGGGERAKRGLDLTAQAREQARQDLTLADDLSRKKQLASAIDKYHAAIYGNPKTPDSHYGLAQTLERVPHADSKDLRESAVQYRAYIALSPDLPVKQVTKLNEKIEHLENKAYKLETKEKQAMAK